MTNIEWLHAVCPYCLEKYAYVAAYKPATCGKFKCVYKHLHKRAIDWRKEVMPSSE